MQGILADVNIVGQVEYLVRIMQSPEWVDLWQLLGLELIRFTDVGLLSTSTDLEIWNCCQREDLLLLTNNRNAAGPESLEAAIRENLTFNSLPVFTIANVRRLATSKEYAARAAERLYEYLLQIDELRGIGRLYLP